MKSKYFYKEDVVFTLWFFGISACTFGVLYFLGLVPSEFGGGGGVIDDLKIRALEQVDTQKTESKKTKITGEEPTHLYIPDASVDIEVSNPNTKDNNLLNEYLTRGAVRYPDSSLLGAGTVLIFGHSSNWKVVQNKAYKALNGIENLKEGQQIFVDSKYNRYIYNVQKVSLVNASQEFVEFSEDKNTLTLSTCDIFGKVERRYVVEANFVEKIEKD